MALRWCAAGMLEAKKQFRRVNGHLHLQGSAHRARAARRGDCYTPSLRYEQGGGRIAQQLGAVTEIPHRSGHPLPALRHWEALMDLAGAKRAI